MERIKELVQWKTMPGERITVGDVNLTPYSQALIVRWPNGAYVWARPASVSVEQNGETRQLPIIDVTRVVQWTLLGLGMLFGLLTFMVTVTTAKRRK